MERLNLNKPFIWTGNQDYEVTYMGVGYKRTYVFRCSNFYPATGKSVFYIMTDSLGRPVNGANGDSIIRNGVKEPEDTMLAFKDDDGSWKMYNTKPWTDSSADQTIKNIMEGEQIVKFKVPVK